VRIVVVDAATEGRQWRTGAYAVDAIVGPSTADSSSVRSVASAVCGWQTDADRPGRSLLAWSRAPAD
jgi:hypothetical protein